MSADSLEEAKRRGREEMARQTQHSSSDEELAVEFVGMTLDETPVIPVIKQTGIVLDEMCLKHEATFDCPAGSAECPDRLRAIIKMIDEKGTKERCVQVPVRQATNEEIGFIHGTEYLLQLKITATMTPEQLKTTSEGYDDVYMCNESFKVASHVVGGVIDLVERIQTGELQNGFALVRPPGHHAGQSEANGYSLLNSVAIAAKIAVEKWNVKRVLVVDWDVHHGQAIQRVFYEDPRVIYFSIHAYLNGDYWPHLPESNWDHVGAEKGKGYNINVPWNELGMGNAEYWSAFQQILLPVALEFNPELVLVAAGFDSAMGDPKGQMTLSTSFYSHMTHMLMGLANGKLGLILEGGYNHTSLSEGALTCLETLLGDPCSSFTPLAVPCPSAQDTILNVIDHLQPYWKCFQTELLHSDRTLMIIPPEEGDTSPREGVTVTKPTDGGDGKKIPPNRTCLVYDERMKRHRIGYGSSFDNVTSKCTEHTRVWMEENEGHPERPERISAIFRKHQGSGLVDRCLRIETRHATMEELALCHSEEHIRDMAETRKLLPDELARKQLDYNSIYLCPDTYDCALLATGSLLSVVDEVLTGRCRSGVAIVRPPGHHAGKDAPSGFCFFNSAPIATKYAQEKYNTQRILIVDWDVHHGNGTQYLLEDDPNVLYISLHRYDGGMFYPGSSGNPAYVGSCEGEGYNVNIGWNSGPMGDAEYLAAFRHVVMPIAYEFNPELVLISAGFDAARGDPLGGYDITPDGYGLMTHMLTSLAGGRVVVVLEGGYNLISISESMARCTHSLLGDPCRAFNLGKPKSSAYGCMLLSLIHHSKYWKCAAYQIQLLKHQIKKMDLHTEQIMEAETAMRETEKGEEVPETSESLKDDVDEVTASIGTLKASADEYTLKPGKGLPPQGTGEASTPVQAPERQGLPPQETGEASTLGHAPERQEEAKGEAQDGAADGGSQSLMGAAGGSDQPTGTTVESLLIEGGVDEATLYAVTPLAWCPHLELVQQVPPKGLDVRATCMVCGGEKENWVCLICYEVFCGRYINQHMVKHGKDSSHPVVLSFADLSVWCYGCEQYVHNETVLPAKQAAHRSKFDEDMPT